MARFERLVQINAAPIVFIVREASAEVLYDRLLQCRVTEIAETERSEHAYLLPASIQPQQGLPLDQITSE